MSFSSRATVAASTKRTPVSGGKSGTPTTPVSSMKIWPLAPVDGQTLTRQNLSARFEWQQTFAEGDYDIQNGDELVIGANKYPIGRCEAWPWRETTRFRLFVQIPRK